MKYAQIAYVDKPVSRFLFGTATQPMMKGEDCCELLDQVFGEGITAFDCARNYGLAEKSLGDWMEKRGLRDKAVIVTKCAHPDLMGRKRLNEKCIRKDFEASSQYLRTSYIDIYLLHRDDPKVDVGEIVELFNAMHAEGKIGAFGGSNWTHRRIQEANEYAYKHGLIPFSVSSPNFGLAYQAKDPWGGGCVTISGTENEDAREWYRGSGMPVLCYSSLARGLFAGKVKSADAGRAGQVLDRACMKGYGCPENFERLARCETLARQKGCSVSQIALAWIFHQGLNAFAIVSASGIERVRENAGALCLELSEDECRYLNLEVPGGIMD